MKTLPDVGKKMRLMAEVEVVRVESSAGKENSSKSLSLQITKMRLK